MKPQKVTKPLLGHFEANGVNPKHKLFEFEVTPDAVLPKGKYYAAVFLIF
jgi:large subunit ribosomal protein L3